MRITTHHIVAAIVGIVGAMGLYARMNTHDDAGHKVSGVKRIGLAEQYMDWVNKREGKGL
jgi:hypothetical protein